MTETRVLHETGSPLDRAQQTMDLLRTVQLTITQQEDGLQIELRHKVRLTVHVDDYVRQSRYTADVWTPGGWQQVARIDPSDPQFCRVLLGNVKPRVGGYDRDPHLKRAFLDEVATALLARAEQVLS